MLSPIGWMWPSRPIRASSVVERSLMVRPEGLSFVTTWAVTGLTPLQPALVRLADDQCQIRLRAGGIPKDPDFQMPQLHSG